MSQNQNNNDVKPKVDSELDNLKKLGIMFDTLEATALEAQKKELELQKDTIIDKAKKQKKKEKILEVQETTESLENITSELVGTLYLPIELFVNDGLESKGITPISEQEIQKLFNLLIKLLPKEAFEKIIEAGKKAKKVDWLKNMSEGIALLKHLFKMFYKRYKGRIALKTLIGVISMILTLMVEKKKRKLSPKSIKALKKMYFGNISKTKKKRSKSN